MFAVLAAVLLALLLRAFLKRRRKAEVLQMGEILYEECLSDDGDGVVLSLYCYLSPLLYLLAIALLLLYPFHSTPLVLASSIAAFALSEIVPISVDLYCYVVASKGIVAADSRFILTFPLPRAKCSLTLNEVVGYVEITCKHIRKYRIILHTKTPQRLYDILLEHALL